jgi:FkbM family methyltransferase
MGTPAPTGPRVPRRDLLAAGAGALAGLAAGVPAGRATLRDKPAEPALPDGAHVSYAQFGEDLVAASLFHSIEVERPTYLDVGAFEPIKYNNTYLFYRRGARGVLVEPNVEVTPKLRAERPGDTVLVAGIGTDDAPEADYYVMSHPELNTFDRAQAERLDREHGLKIVRVIRMPLLNINRVIADHFGGAAPDFLSIDIEGLDYAVLKTLDFARFRPKVVCAETLITATLQHNPETTKLLAENGYEVRGMTYPNVLYMDRRLLGA